MAPLVAFVGSTLGIGATAATAVTAAAAVGAGALAQKALTPKPPEAPASPPLPSAAETQAKLREEAAKERARIAGRQGRRATILTGATGVDEFGQVPVARKTLLGQ